MREPATSAQRGKLHCHKFDCWVEAQDAACTQPEDYCDVRERCGIYFLMTERDGSKKQRKKEGKDASV
jgi:hypothetical protein